MKSLTIRLPGITILLIAFMNCLSSPISAQTKELHAIFKACDSCACQTSPPMEVSIPAGHLFVKIHIKGYSSMGRLGYPMWVTWKGLQKNKTWTGFTSLSDFSNGRITPISHKLTPKEPQEGGEVWSEDEFSVPEPIVVQVFAQAEYRHDGSGACHQSTSEHWIAIETSGTAPSQNNLALGKPTRMSSQYPGSYPASNGVDGNSGSMFHTNIEDNPWWQVDLQKTYTLSSIKLHNRLAPYADRARTIQVLISQDGNTWTLIYKHNGTEFTDLTMEAAGKKTRYVRVQLAEKNYLHLMEVEVFGTETASNPEDQPIVEKFNNYNSHVECSNTDKATFTLNESVKQAQGALWYDFGKGATNVSYTLLASGKTIGRGSVKKGDKPGDCAPGYTWCLGLIELGDLGPGTYTVVASPAQVCHNVNYDGGNGFIKISGR